MRGNIALPFILAAVFMTGCILVRQRERHAEDAEDVLTSTFLIVATRPTIAFLARYADGAPAFQRSSPRLVQTSEAPQPQPKLGLTGIVWRPPRFGLPWW